MISQVARLALRRLRLAELRAGSLDEMPADEETLIAAVTRVRATGVTAAKDVLASLESEGLEASISEVKKACSKAAKRSCAAATDVSPTSPLDPLHVPDAVCQKLAGMGLSDLAVEREFRDAALDARMKESNKLHREVRRAGRPVLHVSGTAFGMVGPGLPLPAGVPANFALKQVATTAFFEGMSRSGKSLGNLKHERLYREFFDDLAADRAAWLPFFEHEENHQHAENTCGILGTLATIYRQRGALDDCEAVLDMEQEVLARYERVSVGAADPAQVRCCEGLAHKYRVIRYNLCLQRQRLMSPTSSS